MSPVIRSTITLLAALSLVAAQESTFPATPLASKHFASPTNLPEKVDTDTNLIRGQQHGYNICNSTTENQNSLCQTSFVNSIDDFCLWAPDPLNSVVADKEGEMVAWCTKPGHGTRLIPADALQGVQWVKTPDYVQVVGFIDQTKINLQTDDFGGEMDPHGADLRGNPMGGVVFSNNFTGSAPEQIIEWHNFMGGNAFCIKVCDPKGPNAAHFCEHIYDRIGCALNDPNAAQNGTFEECLGDNADFPGVYTTNGAVVTYTQPPESLGAITSQPYTPRTAPTSNCVTHTSSVLYAALASVTVSGASSAATSGTSSGGSSASTSKATGKTSTSTGSAAGASNTSNDATNLAISGISLLGVVFSTLFLS